MIRSGSRKCSRRKHRHCPIQHMPSGLFNELRNANGKNRYRLWMIVVCGRKRKLSFTRSFALPAQGWLRLRDDSFRMAVGTRMSAVGAIRRVRFADTALSRLAANLLCPLVHFVLACVLDRVIFVMTHEGEWKLDSDSATQWLEHDRKAVRRSRRCLLT